MRPRALAPRSRGRKHRARHGPRLRAAAATVMAVWDGASCSGPSFLRVFTGFRRAIYFGQAFRWFTGRGSDRRSARGTFAYAVLALRAAGGTWLHSISGLA